MREDVGQCGIQLPVIWYSPSSSSSAVMDLERSVRVVLGALFGGGGAVEKRQGVEDEVEGDENPLALRLNVLLASFRRPAHPVFAALILPNSGELVTSHLARVLFKLHWEPNFFMALLVQCPITVSLCF